MEPSLQSRMASARERADALVESSGAGTMEDLLEHVASALDARLVLIAGEDDFARLDGGLAGGGTLAKLASWEFADHADGVVLRGDPVDGRRWTVAVDARGERWWRAYFTAWHEIAHLLLGEGMDGCSPAPDGGLDPLERAADELGAHLAFHPRIFSPLCARVLAGGEVSFASLEAVREAVHPNASLYATAIAFTRSCSEPLELVSARVHSANERPPTLRIEQVTVSDSAGAAGLCLPRGIRVPDRSVLRAVHGTREEKESSADEDLGWWETRSGALPARRVRVHAVSRGALTYGLFRPVPGGG
jgi:hypothetical protein